MDKVDCELALQACARDEHSEASLFDHACAAQHAANALAMISASA